jgi:CheY-like chemotaxis protein
MLRIKCAVFKFETAKVKLHSAASPFERANSASANESGARAGDCISALRPMTRPTILISDGNPASAFQLSRLCHQAGLAVITDTSGRVVELAKRYRPALILLDVQQMAGDGLEMLAQLRENPLTRHVRVVATSSMEDEFARATALELGSLAFAVKPIDAQFLWHYLRQVEGAQEISARIA